MEFECGWEQCPGSTGWEKKKNLSLRALEQDKADRTTFAFDED